MHLRKPALLLAVVICVLATAPVAHAAAARALVDPLLTDEAPELQADHMRDIGQLRSRYVRLELSWQRGEPAAGAYDEAYFATIDGLLDLAAANGVKVVLTFVSVPRWASDSSLWDDPPGTYPKGYRAFYAPKDTALDDFRAFCRQTAERFKERVYAYECWNEPNLWLFLYPQKTPTNGDFAVDLYFQLLRRCSNGVRAGDPGALVIGGVTAPIGFDDALAHESPDVCEEAEGAGRG